MPITDKILVQHLSDSQSPKDLMGEHGLLRQLTKKLAERALEAELEHHLGYPKNSPSGKNTFIYLPFYIHYAANLVLLRKL